MAQIDFSYITSMFGDDPEFIAEFVSTFETTAQKVLNKMEESFQSKNFDDLRAQAHQLKPSFQMFGLSDAVVKAEKDPEGMTQEKIDAIKDECLEAIKQIKAHFEL